VQKQPRILAFPPIESKFSKSICGSSKQAIEILDWNVDGSQGDDSMILTFFKAIHTPLAPGKELDHMNRVMAQTVAGAVERLKGEKVVRLFEFVAHEITRATTDAVYGPENPFRDPEVAESFWYVCLL
jgi:hypothetical protein